MIWIICRMEDREGSKMVVNIVTSYLIIPAFSQFDTVSKLKKCEFKLNFNAPVA